MSLLSYYKEQSMTVKRIVILHSHQSVQGEYIEHGRDTEYPLRLQTCLKHKYPNKAENIPRLCLFCSYWEKAQVLIPRLLVQEGVLSPGKKMSTPGIRLNNQCHYPAQTCLAVANTYLVVARATIDRTIIPGQEWNLCLSTALSANYGVHLAGSTLAIACTTWRCTTRRRHEAQRPG